MLGPCYCQSFFTGFNKHSFQRYGINYGRKKFYDTGPASRPAVN